MGNGKKEPEIHCFRMELSCYNHDGIMYTYTTPSTHFLTNNEVLSILRSLVPFGTLQLLGASDMSLI